jgi:hypothetical protein
MGTVGAWPTWQDPRIKAAVFLSPYVQPYPLNGNLSSVHVPILLQGGTLDLGITPTLQPVYDALTAPKYFLVLSRAGHLAWTNTACRSYNATQACLHAESNPRLVVYYTRAFFDQSLNADPPNLSLHQVPGLASFQSDTGR